MTARGYSEADEEVLRSMKQFLSAELEAGRTLTYIARTTGDSTRKTRSISFARKAYEAIEEFLPRAPLNESEDEQIREGLDSLRSELEALGESFSESDQVSAQPPPSRQQSTAKTDRTARTPSDSFDEAVREAKRFVTMCERLRAEAKHMLTQNKALMEGRHKQVKRPHKEELK